MIVFILLEFTCSLSRVENEPYFFFLTEGRAPGAPVLDPPLMVTAFWERNLHSLHMQSAFRTQGITGDRRAIE